MQLAENNALDKMMNKSLSLLRKRLKRIDDLTARTQSEYTWD